MLRTLLVGLLVGANLGRCSPFDDPMASLRVVAVSGETLQTFPLERLEASAAKGFGVDAQDDLIEWLRKVHGTPW